MRVELSWEEVLVGVVAGGYRRIKRLAGGRKDGYGHSGSDPWTMDIEGALAEIAVAKHLGLYWSGQGGRNAQDVLGYEVRQTRHTAGHLTVHEHDDDDARYVLVTGQTGKYDIRGWMLGKEAKDPKWEKELQPGRPCFAVPQDQLHKMEGSDEHDPQRPASNEENGKGSPPDRPGLHLAPIRP